MPETLVSHKVVVNITVGVEKIVDLSRATNCFDNSTREKHGGGAKDDCFYV